MNDSVHLRFQRGSGQSMITPSNERITMQNREDARPLYVQRLDRGRIVAEAELAGVLEGLNALRAYLNSPKFRAPSDRQGYVNVEDVLLRLNEATYAGIVAADASMRP